MGLPCWAQSDMKALERKVDDATAVKVDLLEISESHKDLGIIPEDNIFGLGYNYSKVFPLGFTIASTSWKYLYGAVNVGFNFNGENYANSSEEINPSMFFSVEPGFRMKYFVVSCGVGWLKGKSTYVSKIEDGNPVGWSIENKFRMFLQPSVKGFIPICDEAFYLSLNVGYNIVPGFKNLNGLELGVGFFVNIDY